MILSKAWFAPQTRLHDRAIREILGASVRRIREGMVCSYTIVSTMRGAFGSAHI